MQSVWLVSCLALCSEQGGKLTLTTVQDDLVTFTLSCQQNDRAHDNLYWFIYPNTFAIQTERQYKEARLSNIENNIVVCAAEIVHNITVSKTANQTSRSWMCCQLERYWAWTKMSFGYYFHCSNVVNVSGQNSWDDNGTTQARTGTTVPEKKGIDTTQASTDTMLPVRKNVDIEKGTLALRGVPDSVMNDQLIKLTCAIDQPLSNMSMWIVVWTKENVPVLATFQNSYQFLYEDDITVASNIAFSTIRQPQIERRLIHDVTVKTTQYEHVIAFRPSSSLVGRTSWTCENHFLDQPSNTVNITVSTQALHTTHEIGETGADGESTLTAPIIAGVFGGIILAGMAVVIILIGFLSRSKLENKNEQICSEGRRAPF